MGMGRVAMTECERADVRTAYRPLIDGIRGRPGTVDFGEWVAAVDRVFPAVTHSASVLAMGAEARSAEPAPNHHTEKDHGHG